ncbi:hypothetical protein SAMN04487912_11736 [Arthrobacter sp. cf158]|nr:hypothetical protein SAMN04487912_11736 [Arthrobacter sp. cf158]
MIELTRPDATASSARTAASRPTTAVGLAEAVAISASIGIIHAAPIPAVCS